MRIESEKLNQIEIYISNGWLIHPLNGKIPILSGWQNKATTNIDIINLWLQEYPYANIGLLTGEASNLLVVDIDGKEGQASIRGLDMSGAPSVITANGVHYYYRYPKYITGSTTRVGLLPGVDIRGRGGYITAPPSINYDCNNHKYIWENEIPQVLPDPPQWLINLLAPKIIRPKKIFTGKNHCSSNYVNAALVSECQAVENAVKGTRNARLNKAAYSIGTLIPVSDLNIEYAIEALTTAALNSGLKQSEIDKTIASGIKAGINNPRSI